MVEIKGIQKTSMIDYPGKICTIIFTGNCNMRCGFCQNPELIFNKELPNLDEDEIISFMNSRKKWIDGVCVTGGEPLLYPDMPELLKKFKDNDFLVKLDTNGLNPELLKEIIEAKLVDYIAMDIKTDKDNYAKACGVKMNVGKIKESVKLIMESGVDYEFRSTIYPEYFSKEIVKNIGEWIKGAKILYLQQFRNTMPLLNKEFEKTEPFSIDVIGEFKEILEEYVETVKIRA